MKDNNTLREVETELQELITRFCYREGRHGETYLLEKGIKDGLVSKLVELITKREQAVVEEIIKEFKSQRTPMSIYGPKPKENERGFVQFNMSARTVIALDEVLKYLEELKKAKG